MLRSLPQFSLRGELALKQQEGGDHLVAGLNTGSEGKHLLAGLAVDMSV